MSTIDGAIDQKAFYQGVGIAQFNLATGNGNFPEVRPLNAHVLPYSLKTKENKVHLKLLQERCKAAPQQIFG